jgi:hypothetical protein
MKAREDLSASQRVHFLFEFLRLVVSIDHISRDREREMSKYLLMLSKTLFILTM